jgi:hypothetical protein
VQRYGLNFEDGMYDDAQIERYMLQQGGQWTIDGRTFGLGLVEHFKRYWTLLWPEDSQNSWTDLMLKDVLEHQFTVIAGPGCMAGHTRIFDPVTRENPTIQELCEKGIRPTVLSTGGPVLASVPWVKGFTDLYEVTLEDGNKFTATSKHRVLTPTGYVPIGSLLWVSRSGEQSPITVASIESVGKDFFYDLTVPALSRMHYRAAEQYHDGRSAKSYLR